MKNAMMGTARQLKKWKEQWVVVRYTNSARLQDGYSLIWGYTHFWRTPLRGVNENLYVPRGGGGLLHVIQPPYRV